MTIDEKDIVEFTSNGVLVTDERGQILLINRHSEEILNLNAARHIGLPVTDILPLTGARIMECLRTRRPILGAQISGRQVSLMLNVNPVIKGGTLHGTVSTFQELSAFESMARNLESYKRLNRQLETIIHASSDGIWVCDEKGEIVHVNEASENLNGIRAADVVGKTVFDLVNSRLFDRSVTMKVLESKRQESIVQDIPRTRRHLLVTGTPAFDEHGDIFLVVVNERDMTELNSLREKIAQTRRITQKYREELTDLSKLELERHDIGYEKGAFTGASEKGKVGLFELAHTGTLFLDEIGDMPPTLQAKLLTYLDNREIRRLGGTESVVVDCAIVAATNQDIEGMVKQKRFREDLYFRLNSFILQIPPLRERPEDIFELVRFYLEQFNREYGTSKRIRPAGMEALMSHAFPGNVRELKSILKKAVVMSDGESIDPVIHTSLSRSMTENAPTGDSPGGSAIRLSEKLAAVEKDHLTRAMKLCKNTREMAELLGISQPTVVRKMRRHGITGVMMQY